MTTKIEEKQKTSQVAQSEFTQSKRMKSAYMTKFGPPEVLKIKELEIPVPKSKEVLIKVHASTVTAGDAKIRGFAIPKMYWLPFKLILGIRGPRKPVPGIEFAGEIISIGDKITEFYKGQLVFGTTGLSFGANAEYVCLSGKALILDKPKNYTFEESAAIPIGALTALYFLKAAKIQSDQKILIYGASGSVGTYTIQLAKYFGANVTAVTSVQNTELVKSLGADQVIDYKTTDFTKMDEKYDIIFDIVGQTSFSMSLKALNNGGVYLLANVEKFSIYLKAFFVSVFTKKKVKAGVATEKREDLAFLRNLCEQNLLKPVIDKIYPLEEVAKAHKYVDSGRKKGNIIIKVI
jgi:2-desacetyl-2-hydroxyethyl bacteriochlorophyllide A dehydrogenase